MSERMNELFTLTQKAQKMEMINEEIALNLYLEIFEKYTPKISKTYDSAIRLLEKRHRFTEALQICTQAIELIKAAEISGTVEKFDAIKIRLERKIAELEPSQQEPSKKKFKLRWQHVVIGIIILFGFYLLFRFTTPFGDLNVNLDGKESLGNGEGFETETDEKPEKTFPITDDMIEHATNALLKNTEVRDADIIPQEDTLGIAIIVYGGTSETRSKELAEQYIKDLSGVASVTYDELKAPSKDDLGELFDYYNLVISVGTSTKAEDAVANGQMNKGASSIYWQP